jgi:hypothetical protein
VDHIRSTTIVGGTHGAGYSDELIRNQSGCSNGATSHPSHHQVCLHRHDSLVEGLALLTLVYGVKEIKTIRALLKTSDIPVAEIAQRFGIARSTPYRSLLMPAA